jgi:hypothetical protein
MCSLADVQSCRIDQNGKFGNPNTAFKSWHKAGALATSQVPRHPGIVRCAASRTRQLLTQEH